MLGALTIGGLTDEDVILVNDTGLFMARIQIDNLTWEEIKNHEKLLVSVTPARHHIHIVFKGGGDIDWPKFDFKNVHELWFERGDHSNNFKIRMQ